MKTMRSAKQPGIPKDKDKSTLPPGRERLEKEIARLGLASRREAKALILEGKVTVNGKIVSVPGFGIIPDKDTIVVTESMREPKESIVIYKPRGIETTTTTPPEKGTVKDIHSILSQFKHLAPIGRLDKDSEGLIILSNDGTLARALTNASHIEKEYLVTVREAVSEASVQKMASGIMLDKVLTKPATVKKISRSSFTIILHEGRKHQIRRMCDACHLTIESLVRIKIGTIAIGSLRPGHFKKLSAKEVELLKQ